jgi:hypothetical protein
VLARRNGSGNSADRKRGTASKPPAFGVSG